MDVIRSKLLRQSDVRISSHFYSSIYLVTHFSVNFCACLQNTTPIQIILLNYYHMKFAVSHSPEESMTR